LAAFFKVNGSSVVKIDKELFKNLLTSAVTTKEWMTQGIFESRAKDYSNDFRKMPYRNQQEMDAVVGKLEDNSFILQQREELKKYKKEIDFYLQWN
jgi:hypothetical protein